MAPAIHFLSPFVGNVSQVEKERQQSDQRARTARVMHARRKKRASDDKQIIAAETLSPTTSSPSFWKGSSDPFSAWSIELTPFTNQILTCYLNAFLPSIWIPTWLRESPDDNFPSEALVKTKKLAGSRSMARSVDFTFRHPQSIPSWFFVALTTMRHVLEPLNPSGFQELLLQYRTYSLRVLRESIAEIQDESPPATVILQILRVFGAECMINEYLAAKAHAVVIPWIEKVQLEPRVFSGLMGAVMFNDTEIACKLFRKTSLEYETWLPSKLSDFWTHAESLLPPLPPESIESYLYPDFARLEGDSVERALRRLRWALHLRDSLGPYGLNLTENSDLMCAWIQSRTLHDIGLLINQAVDLTSGKKILDEDDITVCLEILYNTDLYTALILTTLYSIRKYLHDCSFNGYDLREAPLIIPKLKSSLIRFLDTTSIYERSGTDEILFWMYFTGAWHGQKQSCFCASAASKYISHITSQQSPEALDENCPRHNSTITWFNTQLAAQARLLGILTWQEAYQLLTHFVFSNIIRPHPSTWYEDIVELYSGLDFSAEWSTPYLEAAIHADVYNNLAPTETLSSDGIDQ